MAKYKLGDRLQRVLGFTGKPDDFITVTFLTDGYYEGVYDGDYDGDQPRYFAFKYIDEYFELVDSPAETGTYYFLIDGAVGKPEVVTLETAKRVKELLTNVANFKNVVLLKEVTE